MNNAAAVLKIETEIRMLFISPYAKLSLAERKEQAGITSSTALLGVTTGPAANRLLQTIGLNISQNIESGPIPGTTQALSCTPCRS